MPNRGNDSSKQYKLEPRTVLDRNTQGNTTREVLDKNVESSKGYKQRKDLDKDVESSEENRRKHCEILDSNTQSNVIKIKNGTRVTSNDITIDER